jgi:hypothetical protein
MDKSIVKLNVGGTIFATRVCILEKSEYLKSITSGRWNNDGDSIIFIDEDPKQVSNGHLELKNI